MGEDGATGLQRRLTGGQLAMIAIGGAIGTGLFMGSGLAIGLDSTAYVLTSDINDRGVVHVVDMVANRIMASVEVATAPAMARSASPTCWHTPRRTSRRSPPRPTIPP